MNNQKTYDKQTAQMIAIIDQNMPEMSEDEMQFFIESPPKTKKALTKGFCSPKKDQQGVVSPVKHTVDLSRSPRLSSNGFEVVKHEGIGVVEIELRSDDNLYVDGKKVEISLSERQKGDKRIVGHELRQELEGGDHVLLNSNILDYVYDHPELFPEHWKEDENGDTRYIYFWASIFRRPSYGGLYVRYFYWDDGVLDRDYRWLGGVWARLNPSASVAS